jgi:predicted AlkP superfamily phosphohydrolase/phosphomutase
VLIGLDAGNPSLVRRFVDSGHLPNLARFIRNGRTCQVANEPGLFVGSLWPTALSGVGVDRHGVYTGIRPGPRSYAYIAESVQADPLWVDVARAGKRVAVLDAPFFPARDDIDAEQLVEWGSHDRYFGPSSWPTELLGQVVSEVGRHPICMVDHPLGYDRYAPCDSVHLSGQHRSLREIENLVADLTEGLAARHRLVSMMYDRGPFDLLVDVVGELHCAGHQLWALHDPAHPDHDPAAVDQLGGDPLLPLYQQVDDLIGLHLRRSATDAQVYVLLSHGMRVHFDGTNVLDEVVWRLDQVYRGRARPWLGPRSQTIDRFREVLPRATQRRGLPLMGAALRSTIGRRPTVRSEQSEIPGPGERLWYPIENNSVVAAIRFNRLHREPNGIVDDSMAAHATSWLSHQLAMTLNADTGRPIFDAVYPSDAHYRRHTDDGLPDLLCDWNHRAPINRVWSPSIGLVCSPYEGVRTGDHDIGGELLVLAGGVAPAKVPGMRAVDIAPTIRAALAVPMASSCGQVVRAMVPKGVEWSLRHPGESPSPPAEVPAADHDDVAELRGSVIDLRTELNGLRAAHHETRVLAESASRVARIALDVLATAAWIGAEPTSQNALISVIVPTRNRADLLATAIASVLEQSYTNLELVVVDDGSSDSTPDLLASLRDPRLRIMRIDVGEGEGAARNLGLESATGDIVCFLDDDNRFDPNWLRSLAWLFESDPSTKIAYGARLVDDRSHHRHGVAGGLPDLELNDWDDAENQQRCLVDVNALAHRPSTARFEVALPIFTDWAYLLDLTTAATPSRLPVLAVRYATWPVDRATVTHRHRHDELYHRVRARPRRPVRFLDQGSSERGGIQASNA